MVKNLRVTSPLSEKLKKVTKVKPDSKPKPLVPKSSETKPKVPKTSMPMPKEPAGKGPQYFMECAFDLCRESGYYHDLEDAYDSDWLSTEDGKEHCKFHHMPDDFQHDHNMKCVCGETGLYVDLDDAVGHGWWTRDEWDFCPDCASDAIEEECIEEEIIN